MSTSYRPAVPPSDARPDPVRLQARRPADLLAAVPFLLGFHPADSVVALFLREGRVLLTARYDLVPGVDLGVQELVEQHRVSGLVLVAYCTDPGRGRAALREQADHLHGAEVVDLLLVDGRRWWSLVCTSDCCPAEGTPYLPDEHPLSAEAVWDPEQVSRSQHRLGDVACLELALLVLETPVRDFACALVTREDARRHLAVWQEVVGRTPPELAPGVLGVLGIAAWADGNGTLLNACCDRLAELDPRYPMGRLLSDVSRRALPPAWWDAMADGLRRDLGLQG